MRLALYTKYLPRWVARLVATVMRSKKSPNGMKQIQADQFAESLTVFVSAYLMLMKNRIPTHDSPEEEWQSFLRGAMKAFISKQKKLKNYKFHNVAIEMFKPIPGNDIPNLNGHTHRRRKPGMGTVGGGPLVIHPGKGRGSGSGNLTITGGSGAGGVIQPSSFLCSDGSWVGPQEPSNPYVSQVWYDTTNTSATIIKVYDGEKWMHCEIRGKV